MLGFSSKQEVIEVNGRWFLVLKEIEDGDVELEDRKENEFDVDMQQD